MPGQPRGWHHEEHQRRWEEAIEQTAPPPPAHWLAHKGEPGWEWRPSRNGRDVTKTYRENQAARQHRVTLDLSAGRAPDFWKDFVPHVRIESDARERNKRGVIPFEPFDCQRRILDMLLNMESIVWLKERQIGASWALAAYSYWLSAYHPVSHVGLVSMGQREASRLQRKVRFIHNHLPLDLLMPYNGMTEMDFESSGSTITSFPSTKSAGVSFTFALIVQDEAARHPYGAENYMEYLATIAQGGQIAICSTADPELGPSGFFFDMVQETINKENDYTFVFDGRGSRPDHDDEFYERERKRYRLSEDTFNAHYPKTIGEAFTGRTGLVYHQFSKEKHVVAEDPMPWGDYLYRLVGIDPGGGDPNAIVRIGVWQDRMGVLRWHQPKGGEFYKRGAISAMEFVQVINRWDEEDHIDRIYDGSTGGATLLGTLRQFLDAEGASRCWPALKDRDGIGTFADLLDSEHFTIHEDNVHSIAEFNGYRWLDRTDPNDKQRYKTATPVDNHADAMDARRYAIASFLKVLQRSVAGGFETPRDQKITGNQDSGRMEMVWR